MSFISRIDAAISDSPNMRSKRGLSKTLLSRGLSRRLPPKRSQELLRASETTRAPSPVGPASALLSASFLASASTSTPWAFSSSFRAASSACWASHLARASAHLLVFSAFLASSVNMLKKSLDLSITVVKVSLVFVKTTREPAAPVSEALFSLSAACLSASFSCCALSRFWAVVDFKSDAFSFQELRSSDVREEALLSLSPQSAIRSSTIPWRLPMRSADFWALSQSFFILGSFSMSLFTWSMTCLMKLLSRCCCAMASAPGRLEVGARHAVLLRRARLLTARDCIASRGPAERA
mmetsp:Transcript_68266/g.200464  ORF Transcript_68266/g.200464 Transcript_68266/m.200464 type:complete len:295 (+) Transcript_68266:865-1749(+)